MKAAPVIMLVLFAISGCSNGSSDPSTGSETHWQSLLPCSDDSDCGSALSCLCGICTTTCTSDDACTSLDTRATCIAQGHECVTSAGGQVCVLPCTDSSTCAEKHDALACMDGRCLSPGDWNLVPPDPPPGSTCLDDAQEPWEPGSVPRLPRWGGVDFECDPDSGELPLDICTWALPAEHLVWGTIRGVRTVQSPAILADSRHAGLVAGCEGGFNNGLEIELEIEEALLGALSGVVKVRFGFDHIDYWVEYPDIDEDGCLQWRGTPNLEAPLLIGQKIGMSLFYVNGYDLWSTLRQPIFTLVAGVDDGPPTLAFQAGDMNPCIPDYLPSLDGMTVTDLRAALGQCEPNDETRRRQASLIRGCGSRPICAFAAICFTDVDAYLCSEAEPECPAGTVCEQTSCVSPGWVTPMQRDWFLAVDDAHRLCTEDSDCITTWRGHCGACGCSAINRNYADLYTSDRLDCTDSQVNNCNNDCGPDNEVVCEFGLCRRSD
ncbi:MAG: hypothetical protein ACNA8W_10240 [Bradymonadaceae bacterium]